MELVKVINNPAIEAFEEYASALMKKDKIPGAAVGFSKNGQLVYEKGFGYANLEEKLKANIDTVFCIGSITKSFTSISLLKLQEDGKLSVNDPVTKYLPEFQIKNSNATKKMKLHHLMTHSSGMPTMPFMANSMFTAMNEDLSKDQATFEMLTNHTEPETYEELMAKIAELDIELLAPPGKLFSYSNECYCLLGAVIERVSGIAYERYVKETILEPAGMQNSSFFIKDLKEYSNITQPYVARKQNGVRDIIASPNWWNPPAMRATGLLNSTVRDMLRYTELYRTGGRVGSERILTEESVEQMTNPYIETNMVPGQYYGYGLMITPNYHGSKLIEHTGGGKGVTAKMKILPEKGLTSTGLSNLYMSLLPGIVDAGMNAFEGRPLEASNINEEIYYASAEDLSEYVGDYLSGERGVITARINNDKLEITAPGAKYVLEGVEKDLFKVKSRGSYGTVRFFRNTNDQLIKISLNGRILKKI